MRRTTEQGFEPQTPEIQARRQETKEFVQRLTQPIVDEIVRLSKILETMPISDAAAARFENMDLMSPNGPFDPNDARALNKTPVELKRLHMVTRLEGLRTQLGELQRELEDTGMDIWKSEQR